MWSRTHTRRLGFEVAFIMLACAPAGGEIITIGSPDGATGYAFKNLDILRRATDMHITILSAVPPTPNFKNPHPDPTGAFEDATVDTDDMGRPRLTFDGGLGVFVGDTYNLDFSLWPIGTKFDVVFSYPDFMDPLVIPDPVDFDGVITPTPTPSALSLLAAAALFAAKRRR